MRLLVRSFLRRGWLRAVAAGVAGALSLVAVVFYMNISADLRRRSEHFFAGSMPADGCITLYNESFEPEQQDSIAATPGVSASEFTALAYVLLPSGPGWLEGVDFIDSFFGFTLSEGRLPSAEGEALLDATLEGVAGYEVATR